MLSMINGYKTYIVAGVSIIAAWVAVWNNTSDVATATHVTEAALTAMTIRHGMKTGA